MATNREKVVYNITLQSEEDEEVKVIDRFNLIRVKSFLIAQHLFSSRFSSSMAEMSRKRKICCGLSSCCGKGRSESAQMIAGKSSTQPLTRGQKCGNCCCWPFRKIGNAFKRRKVDSTDSMDMKPSWWERICCCSACCRRCRKGDDKEKMTMVSCL